MGPIWGTHEAPRILWVLLVTCYGLCWDHLMDKLRPSALPVATLGRKQATMRATMVSGGAKNIDFRMFFSKVFQTSAVSPLRCSGFILQPFCGHLGTILGLLVYFGLSWNYLWSHLSRVPEQFWGCLGASWIVRAFLGTHRGVIWGHLKASL